MLSILCCIVFAVVVIALTVKLVIATKSDGVIEAYIALMIIAIGSMLITKTTFGLYPGYSTGVRVGYVTKASMKGLLFKTNEIQIQVGTGEMAALQEPHPLSVRSETLMREIESRVGQKGTFHYTEWLVMPYWVGESGYEVTAVEWEKR